MVVTDILKTRFNAAMPANLYYYHDSNGNEVDLIFENRRTLTPVETKPAMTVKDNMTGPISHVQKIKPRAGMDTWSAGELDYSSEKYELRNFKNTRDIFSNPS